MEVEVEFLHKSFPGKDPKLLTDHMRRVASGEASFFPNILSLVYDMLIEKSFPNDAPSDSGTTQIRANQNATTSAPFETCDFGFTPSTPLNPRPTTGSPTPGPSTTPTTIPPTDPFLVGSAASHKKKGKKGRGCRHAVGNTL